MKNQGVGDDPVTGSALDQEQLLVERIKDGDEAALEEPIHQYGGKIYYLALQYTKNPQDAEEVRQEVLLKVFRRIETFRSAAWLSPWLYKIAVNASLMKLREQRKRRVCAIENLPMLYKTVVQLRDIDGLPMEEISRVVRISIPEVKSRLHRARRIIHKHTRFLSQQGRKRRPSQ